MLVLGRCKDESIVIGDNIEIKIVDVRIGGAKRVMLGITAPRNIPVHRKEVQEAIIRERQSCGVGDKRLSAVGL